MENIKKYISDYFFRAEEVIKKFNPNAIVVLQFFQRRENTMLAGMTEVLKLLEDHTDTSKYKIRYLEDGSIVQPREVVLELEGHYQDFGVFEGVIDGILARSSSIATNAHECIQAAKGKDIIYMADRADHYLNQHIDGLAAEVAGIKTHSTEAGARKNLEDIFGSIPHALIQSFEGDLVKALEYYHQLFPELDLIALVDFNNDVISDSLKVLKRFGKKLYGVRVDTSAAVQDKMFKEGENQYGVTVEQIKRLRKALDENDGKNVKIIVSSGFNAKKIADFEAQNAPVDSYGVGEYMLEIKVHFSADATMINNKKIAKFGRGYSFNPKLKEYKNDKK
ncbi:nicotinate phosphoribosyltransferase [Mesomycoplasma hyorhinis]|uniref:Nicotinate phosphoribosyltransferase n=2 Tax=Mesomycoplasma hyorhinis TaxID=2100 RepID=A0AAI8AMW4_MESHY|nr:nicotinate phosphoribosyltransferase [Mesomycoplasma hyorhinis]AEC45610.1 nicotinate phosphoribosyltransferase [Mesomycoplasma hyorhinis MCLD]AEX14030.1 nicotinic acid phosphoribosyltransferase [Mesomycoplasma hyorhinis GDL-1]AFX74300.1 Nicotinate phosphoribosyltransferase [Mesomycoplasma hyorhinis SK76]AHA41015.1 nicotinate phosphoribosyl transferase [Mesomycoplasma hyorhinis DBS 1050]TRM74001.1 nicotinate phosphoribosyltransferase [Sulfolobus sp. A20-N-F8]TRM84342.1 nicotinate phosphorib